MADEMTAAESCILNLRGYMDGLWSLAKRSGADASACADYAKHMHHAVDRLADEVEKTQTDAGRYRYLRNGPGVNVLDDQLCGPELDAAIDVELTHSAPLKP